MSEAAILVTGGSGQIGTELRRLTLPGLTFIAPPRAELDLALPEQIAAAVAARRWSAIINGAAYTAVDAAQQDIVTTWRINALAPAMLAAASAEADIPLIQLSTDYVFDGSKPAPYVEDDPTGPLNVYGASKLGGELAVRTGNPRHLILRTAWVVSAHGRNFLKTMLQLADTRDQVDVVDDQLGCPTGARDIAETLGAITRRLVEDRSAPCGTYHFVNRGEASWFDLAREIFSQRATPVEVRAISTADRPTPARRPANSRLSTTRLTHDFGIEPRSWQAAIADILSELQGESR